MKHHEIDLDGLTEWMTEKTVEFASSTRERKRLVVSLKGNFIVAVAGKVVWQGLQPFGAVEAYNSITDAYITPTS